jgi:aminopeptidase N
MKIIFVSFLLAFLCQFSQAQFSLYTWDSIYTEKDSIRGTLLPNRSCYDVLNYHLSVYFEIEEKAISGHTTLTALGKCNIEEIQIDLFENLTVTSLLINSEEKAFYRKYDAIFIPEANLREDSLYRIEIFYRGQPKESKKAPWDGGFVWKNDDQNRPFIGVACQGLGASVWWPNKDHLSDLPDQGMSMDFFLKDSSLFAISNGQRIGTEKVGEYYRHSWKVDHPIHNYNVTFYIGNYVFFEELYTSAGGTVTPMHFYVLDYNLDKARVHFQQVPQVLASLEWMFGPYPFASDGYKLVEAPYLGMEHQSAIAYGNLFLPGYLGMRIPEGQDWDYIIMHETGHEWWGNSVRCKDNAEMWIHESMTTYSESLFVESLMGKNAYHEYINSQRWLILNKEPLVGPLGVNYDFYTTDIYYKGAWLYHTLRNLVDNDYLWLDFLRKFYLHFQHSSTDTHQILSFWETHLPLSHLNALAEQYLYSVKIPKLILRTQKLDDESIVLSYHLEESHPELALSLRIDDCDQSLYLHCSTSPQEILLESNHCIDFKKLQEYYLIKVKLLE